MQSSNNLPRKAETPGGRYRFSSNADAKQYQGEWNIVGTDTTERGQLANAVPVVYD